MAEFTFDHSSSIEAAQHEKRTYPRAANRLLVRVVQGNSSVECSSLDFSMAGIRLLTSKELDRSKLIEMEIYLPQEDIANYEGQKPVKLLGKISWQRMEQQKYVCGVAFEKMSDEVAKRLRESFRYYNKEPEFGVSR
jgi:methyl-accepting chemotaxis protein